MPQFSCPRCRRIFTVQTADLGCHGTCPCGQRLLLAAQTKLAEPYAPTQTTTFQVETTSAEPADEIAAFLAHLEEFHLPGLRAERWGNQLIGSAGGEVFTVDVEGGVLAWHSSNDAYWRDVMRFFRL